jgi:type II restriction enzyme
MNLVMPGDLAVRYSSGAQRARVVTESWAEQCLYCPNCSSPSLERLSNNTKASDYRCAVCESRFQLKGQKTRLGERINDGAYRAMAEAIRLDETPNFYFLQYDLPTWQVVNLLLVPSFALSLSAIIQRRPLSASARRAGWVGCLIDLSKIPQDARIAVVAGGTPQPVEKVRSDYARLKPLADVKTQQRGWLLDVLTIVRRLGKAEFKTADIYAFERELEALHPDNRHVQAKIRQQLQDLRDTGFLTHPERGTWRVA